MTTSTEFHNESNYYCERCNNEYLDVYCDCDDFEYFPWEWDSENECYIPIDISINQTPPPYSRVIWSVLPSTRISEQELDELEGEENLADYEYYSDDEVLRMLGVIPPIIDYYEYDSSDNEYYENDDEEEDIDTSEGESDWWY